MICFLSWKISPYLLPSMFLGCVVLLCTLCMKLFRNCFISCLQCFNVNLIFSRFFTIFHFPKRGFHFPCHYWWYFFGLFVLLQLGRCQIILSRTLLFVPWSYLVLGSLCLVCPVVLSSGFEGVCSSDLTWSTKRLDDQYNMWWRRVISHGAQTSWWSLYYVMKESSLTWSTKRLDDQYNMRWRRVTSHEASNVLMIDIICDEGE